MSFSNLTMSNKQYGENGGVEYRWSYNIQEVILQFYFQLVRTNAAQLSVLEMKLRDILYFLKFTFYLDRNAIWKKYLILLYKLIGHSRDKIDGKGERDLTYMMIAVWYDFFPELALFALQSLNEPINYSPSYGCWKDMKYFCNYYKEKIGYILHPLIIHCIQMINQQLRLDYCNYNKNNSISFVAKWVPREKSKKFGWLFSFLAYNYFKEFIQSAQNPVSMFSAQKKCKAEYRKLLSQLNNSLGTLEVKQCAKQWSTIDFSQVSCIAFHKQTNTFLKNSHYDDRQECKEKFIHYIENSNRLHSQLVEMNEFTKKALQIIRAKKYGFIQDQEEKILNKQWQSNSLFSPILGNIIPVVDLSSTMSGEAYNTAISLAIRIAEKSSIGKGIILSGSIPKWINLGEKETFLDCIKEIINHTFGITSDLLAVFDLIINTIMDVKMSPENIKNLSIVIISDMQIMSLNKECLNEIIKTKFKLKEIPEIIFWNLRSTNGFPCFSNEYGFKMISGFNVNNLYYLSRDGKNTLGGYNSWILLERILNNKRYSILEDKSSEYLESYFRFSNKDY